MNHAIGSGLMAGEEWLADSCAAAILHSSSQDWRIHIAITITQKSTICPTSTHSVLAPGLALHLHAGVGWRAHTL